MPRLGRGFITPRRLACKHSTSPGVNIWGITNLSNWSPIVVGAVFSSGSIAQPCISRICWATFDAMRATPCLLALGPALDPIGEGRVAIVLCSRNFPILPTTLAMLIAAPLFLPGRPLRRPVRRPISAIERIDWTSGGTWHDGRSSFIRDCTRNDTPRTTTCSLLLRPMVLVFIPVLQAFVGGPEEVAEQPQGQQQASECRKYEQPTHVAAASRTVVATIADILHCWLHGKLALAVPDIHQIRPVPIPRVTGICGAIHRCKNPGKSAHGCLGTGA